MSFFLFFILSFFIILWVSFYHSEIEVFHEFTFSSLVTFWISFDFRFDISCNSNSICHVLCVCCILHYPLFCLLSFSTLLHAAFSCFYVVLHRCNICFWTTTLPLSSLKPYINLSEITLLILQACNSGDPPLCCIAWDREGVSDSAQWDGRELERTSLWAYRRGAESNTQWHGRRWVCPECRDTCLINITHLEFAVTLKSNSANGVLHKNLFFFFYVFDVSWCAHQGCIWSKIQWKQ